MSKEVSLRAWLGRPREELTAALVSGVRTHVGRLAAAGHSFYGYAVAFGVGGDPTPWVVTNRLEDLSEPRASSEYDYFLYAVNEWEHWWTDGPIQELVQPVVTRLEGEFRDAHAALGLPESDSYDSWEMAHFDASHQAYLRALQALRAEGVFGADVFVTLYLGGSHWDSGWPIVEQSVRALNPPEVVARYLAALG